MGNKRSDVETGLYYNVTRYYNPQWGRFLNADDVSYLDPESINGLNLYAYCGNNPIMGYDPMGTWDWSKFFGIVTIVGVTAIGIGLCFVPGAQAFGAGILIGGTFGGFFGGVSAAASGGNVWNGITTGTLFGAAGGLIGATGIGIGATGASFFGLGFAQDVVTQIAVDGKKIGDVNLVQSFVAGAISSIFAMGSKGLSNKLSNLAIAGGKPFTGAEMNIIDAIFSIPVTISELSTGLLFDRYRFPSVTLNNIF